MAKNRQFLLPGLASVLLLSCTMKDDIRRDIIIETDSINFSFPITTNFEDTVTIAELQNKVDLNQQVTDNTDQFTLANLRSAYITKFVIKLDDPDTNGNDLSAFSTIKVQMKAAAKPLIQLGATNNISTQNLNTLNVTITAATQQLQEYLNADGLTYVISGVGRDATTKVIQAKAVAGYKLTLGM
jgi:peptidoglycan hydrolase-like protein with peptidoglycan-binding domain